MDKFVHADEDSIDGTGYNDAPIGLRKISEKEFAQSAFFTECPTHKQHKQITRGHGQKTMLALQIYWFHDKTGIGISRNYWEGKVTYWACGCDHDYKELHHQECARRRIHHYGNCFHVCECSKCKHVMSYDSGD